MMTSTHATHPGLVRPNNDVSVFTDVLSVSFS